MAFPYHFPSNTPAQTSRRRQLLDAYGQFAQLSAIIIPLFLFLLYHSLRFLSQNLRLRRGNGYAALQPSGSHHPRKKLRQSPRVATFSDQEAAENAAAEEKRRKLKGKGLSASIAQWWARFRWALGEPVGAGWGTWREWTIGAAWTAWLLFLTVNNTGDDYLHLTRRFGIVAASQLPLHYLLSMKSWSPIQYLTGLSHEELNPYHRLLGRILTGFFFTHGSLYLNYYVQLSILSTRLRSAEVLLGLCASTTLFVLNSTALAKVRTWSYRLFIGSHVLLSIIILPLLYFHVSHARPYVLEAAFIFFLLIVQRKISSTPVLAVINQLPSSPLLSIRIVLTPRLARRRYYPGQHIYLSLPAMRSLPLNRLRHHPFTIATLPAPSASTAEMQLVIRPIRGTTQLLSSLAQQSQTPLQSRLLIEGPYGASRCFLDLLHTHHRILLVAGGVGATFTLPIYRHLLQQQKQQQQQEEAQPYGPLKTNQQVRFVWSVRSIADATWGLQQLQLEEDGDEQGDVNNTSRPTSTSTRIHGCDLYITGSNSSPPLFPPSSTTLELHSPAPPPSSSPSSYQLHNGRPNLRAIVDGIFTGIDTATHASAADDDDDNDDEGVYEDGDGDGDGITTTSNSNSNSNPKLKVAVLVCGPVGMGAALRREVGRWVRRGKGEAFWHDEEFGW